jgi:ribosomal protein S1
MCLVVFDYRVKVLIPYSEMWVDAESEQRPGVMKRFLGAEVDYIVTKIDREGNCVVASRAQAISYRRKAVAKRLHKPGDLVDCRILAVSTTRILVECEGYESVLSQRNISYGTILDLREDYRPGQTVKAVFKGFEEDRIQLSIKEVNPHPFDDVESRHPLHCRRLSRIMGKYAGGVFCSLEKDFTCLCLYTTGQKDSDFNPGDDVIIVVTKYDYHNKLVYGRIVSSW